MRIFLFIILFFLSGQVFAFDANFAKDWPQVKGTHFIVSYPNLSGEGTAQEVLRQAEAYYNRIADDIGYARYQKFWTWEERVKIIIFDDKESFVRQTGQPAWSEGFAAMHGGFFDSRTIVSFRDQPDFLTKLLPHEITHLIVHDFIGSNRNIPLFFDEGVAQLEQVPDESIHYKGIMAQLIVQGKNIPVAHLVGLDIRGEQDGKTVAIFYVESLYIIDFLVKTYGKDAFQDLCRNLRDGQSFEMALKKSYPSLGSLTNLESQWIKYMMQYL